MCKQLYQAFDCCLIYHGFYCAGIPYSFAVVNYTCTLILLNTDVISAIVNFYQCKNVVYAYGYVYSGAEVENGIFEVSGKAFVCKFTFSSAIDANAFVGTSWVVLREVQFALKGMPVSPSPNEIYDKINDALTTIKNKIQESASEYCGEAEINLGR
ncbi:hypothetical protein [Acidianus ambivalens]|uniref:Uncharacterized protein n=1 Tax=Acidianus ambivalens TaxID=2283 RepID=A0A650CTP7_ACIAM|nr:hypothetical protein [Acidianus ambivalens]MQL56238.1 hypothetical protein [Acidianus ambivalens]QGR21224.1 hypothetical protein D1866_03810 [Acidianus ambivalens]